MFSHHFYKNSPLGPQFLLFLLLIIILLVPIDEKTKGIRNKNIVNK
jgi:hypothetical protein